MTDAPVSMESTKKVKLVDLFDEYPPEDELIWNFVGRHDFENELYNVETVPTKSVMPKGFIANYNANAEPWQKKLVKQYISRLNTIKPIIVSNNIVVDGHHRLMACIMATKPTIEIVGV